MAFFADLSRSTYVGAGLVAVGWLEGNREYSRGEVSQGFVEALARLLAHPWQPETLRGLHECSLCLPVPPTVDPERPWLRIRQPGDPPTGFKNLFVPGEAGLFVAPELILHYVRDHGYAPPDVFVRAVLACPPMSSRGYIEAVRSHGHQSLMGRPLSQWTELAELDEDLERRVLLEAPRDAQRRVALACVTSAVEASGLAHPLVDRTLLALRGDEPLDAGLVEAGKALAEDLHRAAFHIEEPGCSIAHPHPGQPCEPAFRRAIAANVVERALSGDPAQICVAILYTHRLVCVDWDPLRRAVLAAIAGDAPGGR